MLIKMHFSTIFLYFLTVFLYFSNCIFVFLKSLGSMKAVAHQVMNWSIASQLGEEIGFIHILINDDDDDNDEIILIM